MSLSMQKNKCINMLQISITIKMPMSMILCEGDDFAANGSTNSSADLSEEKHLGQSHELSAFIDHCNFIESVAL